MRNSDVPSMQVACTAVVKKALSEAVQLVRPCTKVDDRAVVPSRIDTAA